jgi:carbonic anhydrase
MSTQIVLAETDADFRDAEALIREYIAFLNVDVSFQNFAHEIAHLPVVYGAPDGALILAKVDGEVAGSIGLKRFDKTRCEMKRLYVYPRFQGLGLGQKLVTAFIEQARRLGYEKTVLDTIPRFGTAVRMYEKMGFYEIEPYYDNPHRHTMHVHFFECEVPLVYWNNVVRQFKDKTLPKEQWTHEAHFVVGLWHVIHEPETALDTMRDAIRAYNEAVGGRNTATEGYHETLTVFYMKSLAHFAQEHGITAFSVENVDNLLKSHIVDRKYPLRFYAKPRLFSVQARQEWLEPDLTNDSINNINA